MSNTIFPYLNDLIKENWLGKVLGVSSFRINHVDGSFG
jgi:hypothetical protein